MAPRAETGEARVVAFHPHIRAMLYSIEPSPLGPRLSEASLLLYGNALFSVRAARERDLAASQLIVLIRELSRRGKSLLMAQLVMLLVATLGPRTHERLLQAGLTSPEARRMIDESSVTSATLTGGLASPGRPLGVRTGPRRR